MLTTIYKNGSSYRFICRRTVTTTFVPERSNVLLQIRVIRLFSNKSNDGTSSFVSIDNNNSKVNNHLPMHTNYNIENHITTKSSVLSIQQQQKNQHDHANAHSKHQKIVQLNKKIANANNCNEILNLIEHTLDKNGGGGLLNHISFSTIVNRLARYISRNKLERRIVFTDERFSLLFASLAEALVSSVIKNIYMQQQQHDDVVVINFDSQALTNIGWAIAKIGISVPISKLPSLRAAYGQNDDEYNNNSNISVIMSASAETIVASARNLRAAVSHNNTTNSDTIQLSIKDEQKNRSSVSELNVLTSQILDYIGIVVTTNIDTEIAGDDIRSDAMINLHGCGILLWSWAITGRADTNVFESVTLLMTNRAHTLLESNSINMLEPQAMSNALWAVRIFFLNLISLYHIFFLIDFLFFTTECFVVF
jgi:hypothetical protein